MVGKKGCSGGWRPGAGRRPGATTIKKKVKSKVKKPSKKKTSAKPTVVEQLKPASATFFENWHTKMMLQAAEDKAQLLAAAAARKAANGL